jgi:acetyl esterase/lipase
MSPLLASPESLSKFPPTMIQVSQNDPLRDYGILFAIKLKKAGVNVELNEHLNVPHGVLNMNGPIFELKKEANDMISECAQYMRKIGIAFNN